MADEDEDKDKDKDKKPRYKMGADELVQETHGSVKEIINLLDSKGLAQESVEHLTTLDNKLDFMVCSFSRVHIFSDSRRSKLNDQALLSQNTVRDAISIQH